MAASEEAPELGSPAPNTPLRPVVKLTPEWAESVAREFVARIEAERGRGAKQLVVKECWVASDLAICLRYGVVGNEKDLAARRISNPNIDPTSGGYAETAAQQAFWYYHDLPGLPAGEVWVDRLGYSWDGYGDPPASWEDAVERLPRIVTVKESVREVTE